MKNLSYRYHAAPPTYSIASDYIRGYWRLPLSMLPAPNSSNSYEMMITAKYRTAVRNFVSHVRDEFFS
ncbi:MAG: hypothetical protein M1332_00385 [Deltaproteobacteria bacterium]|nr:hypothetical protein [Deltaproteobacteria bacterium]